MSIGLPAQRRFYTTEPAPCPYLENRVEQRIVTTLGPDARTSLSFFTQLGFRRSQTFLYRPACPGCRACVPVRIVVDRFTDSRGWRKILRRNEDLRVAVLPAAATDEQFELFRRYQLSRHGDGSMALMDRVDYAALVEDAAALTLVAEFRFTDGRLAGASITDRLSDGLSGVYKFFEPNEARRSLGTFIILWHIAQARALGLPYVYLGYWIAGAPTMAYKARFQPLERLTGQGWDSFPNS